MSHTEGRLSYAHRERADGTYATELFDEKGKTVAVAAWYPIPTESGFITNRDDNARRLVACWNYCLRMTTEDIEAGSDWVSGAIELANDGRMVAAIKHCRAITGWGLKKAHDEIKTILSLYPEES